MTTNDTELSALLQAVDLEHRAEYACKKGNHALARELFCRAGDTYMDEGRLIRAAYCYGQAQAEARLVLHTGPVNVSGLVD